MLRILPQKFYDDPALRKILVDGHSCIIHKQLLETVLGKEGYVAQHALTMVMQGTLRMENEEEGLFLEVTAGHLVLIPKGLYTVSDILPRNGVFEAMMFFFEPGVVREFMTGQSVESEFKCQLARPTVFRMDAKLRFFAESLLHLYDGAVPASRQLTKLKLLELLHLLQAAIADQGRFLALLAALNRRERRSLREFMEANFHKPLGIEDYAYLTGRSVSTFTRDFKTKFAGVSPKQWLIERRLARARGLLAQPEVGQIADVAGESGYGNVPHFIKAFHKKYGITPKQFLIESRKRALV
ncbi:AraC family transcriptional regulator [Neolewinella lacunae]|uniref:Helix-turn-helix transcriptional regulator n=1 Tax=Neolewinella lacunae TaxID=1517758 RepID=A0A923T7M7_9BACT|nr:AraC family transcriptional regulator [Neolewinella lacunae]MBC6993043.1 helix-turn-helix transcriptional regulator [Neolewinella lacunae]MDN3635865.1 AraC family transcriptional regulator [Neolewinella lacunae]